MTKDSQESRMVPGVSWSLRIRTLVGNKVSPLYNTENAG